MTTLRSMALQAAALCLINSAQAGRIKKDGMWTNSTEVTRDWYDNVNKIGVANGVPYSNDADMARRIEAPVPEDGDVSDYDDGTYENVERVDRVLGQTKWDEIFPQAKLIYTYEGFLRAVAKFPAFCDESDLTIGSRSYSADETCKRELATLFAHFGQETTFLQHITEWKCTEPQYAAGTSECDYKSYSWVSQNFYPAESDPSIQYYGRGPFQVSWNYNYGAFGKVLNADDGYYAAYRLLEDPALLETDSYTVFVSALWFFMTPQNPKPSMHEVATGFMKPTPTDKSNGIQHGYEFGATTNIINNQECGGRSVEDTRSQNRIDYYEDMLEEFNLPDEPELTMGCKSQGTFGAGGYGHHPLYFAKKWWPLDDKCQVVNWQTGYSAYTPDDYKRCVCDSWATSHNMQPSEACASE